jgi:hypothetical protein
VVEELEPFAARASEMRELAVHRIFRHLSDAAGGSSSGVRFVARLSGTNATAIESLSRGLSRRGLWAPGVEKIAREDSIEFVREASPRLRSGNLIRSRTRQGRDEARAPTACVAR